MSYNSLQHPRDQMWENVQEKKKTFILSALFCTDAPAYKRFCSSVFFLFIYVSSETSIQKTLSLVFHCFMKTTTKKKNQYVFASFVQHVI